MTSYSFKFDVTSQKTLIFSSTAVRTMYLDTNPIWWTGRLRGFRQVRFLSKNSCWRGNQRNVARCKEAGQCARAKRKVGSRYPWRELGTSRTWHMLNCFPDYMTVVKLMLYTRGGPRTLLKYNQTLWKRFRNISFTDLYMSRCFRKNCEKRLLASSCPSVYPSAWNISAPTGRI
jgi:hypothetical protein